MDNKPDISVLMSVYNGEKYLLPAVESILQQSFQDFEFLIINDGSDDSTRDLLDSLKDSRIKIITNHKNLGLTKSLNIGLQIAAGKYIARFDSDDIAFRNRLMVQYHFLEQNPHIGVLGTNALSNGKYFRYKTHLPETDPVIKWKLFFMNPFIHPAVMFRKDLVLSIGGYNEERKAGQDYDLWTRLAPKTKFANLPGTLVFLRWHQENISVKSAEKQHAAAIETVKTYLYLFTGKNYTGEEMEAFFFQRFKNNKDRHQSIALIKQLYDIFTRETEMSEKEKRLVLHDKNKRILRIKFPYLGRFLQ
jgi:glycosyltransferase involved in cell wall biosynthesis